MSNSDWFAKKLNQGQPQQAVAPQAYPPQSPIQPTQPTSSASQQNRPPALRCPGCGSENYGGPQGYLARCYDCGFPIQQSGSGLGKGIVNPGASSAGPATPALQIPTGGFNGTKPAIGPDGGFL